MTRKSKGVAFIMYLLPEDAKKCVESTNLKEMYGRTLKASIAQDNGRSAEFIKKKVCINLRKICFSNENGLIKLLQIYPDKTTCFECGETGHLSYSCSKNLLGNREPPPKKKRKRKPKAYKAQESKNVDIVEDSDHISDDETLSAAIAAEV